MAILFMLTNLCCRWKQLNDKNCDINENKNVKETRIIATLLKYFLISVAGAEEGTIFPLEFSEIKYQ